MTGAQEKRAQDLAAKIEGNVRSLQMGGFWEIFMQAQRRTWAEIHKEKTCVIQRVNEILHPERMEPKTRAN